MKVKYEADKYNRTRIRRFARPSIDIIFQENIDFWERIQTEYKTFETSFGLRVSCDRWEAERLAMGLPNLSMFATNLIHDMHFRVATVKAAIRKVQKIARFLPHKTAFEDCAGWRKYGVTIFVDNPGYTPEKAKGYAYEGVTVEALPAAYRALTGIRELDFAVNKFRDLGYFVEVEWQPPYNYISGDIALPYWSVMIIGKGLRAGYCSENESSYRILNNKIALEAADCFDKWSKCEYQLVIPTNEDEWLKTLEIIQFVTDMENGYYSDRWDDDMKAKRESFKQYEYTY